MSEHQPLSTLSNFAFIGSYVLTWLWLASMRPHPCVHTNTHSHTHISTFKHSVCFTCPALSCLAGIISSYSAKGSKVTSAWQHEHHVLPLFGGYVCLCVVNVTVWPLWSSSLSWSFPSCVYIQYNIHSLYAALFPLSSSACQQLLSSSCPPASIPAPPFLLISPSHLPQSSYFLRLTLPRSSWHRLTGLSPFILPSETHIVSESTESCTVSIQSDREPCPTPPMLF